MKKIFLVLFFSSCFKFVFSATTFPTAGDDLPIEINYSSQVLYEGDRVGFVGTVPGDAPYGLFWAAGGIDLQKSAVPGCAIFGTPLAVDKELNLDVDVFLAMARDVYLADGVRVSSSGDIEGKTRAFVLTGVFSLEGNTITFRNNHNSKISGNGNSVDFSKGGKLVFNDDGSPNDLYIENCYLKGFQENSIIFLGDARDLFLTNCVIQLDGNFCANFDINIYGDVLITGTHSFCINRQLRIQDGGHMMMDIGTTFSMGYYGDIDTWGNGALHFNGCNIEIGDNYGQSGDINNGFFLKTGTIIFENEVHINDDEKRKFFQIADGADVTFLSGAQVILDGTTTFSIGGNY